MVKCGFCATEFRSGSAIVSNPKGYLEMTKIWVNLLIFKNIFAISVSSHIHQEPFIPIALSKAGKPFLKCGFCTTEFRSGSAIVSNPKGYMEITKIWVNLLIFRNIFAISVSSLIHKEPFMPIALSKAGKPFLKCGFCTTEFRSGSAIVSNPKGYMEMTKIWVNLLIFKNIFAISVSSHIHQEPFIPIALSKAGNFSKVWILHNRI
ncbi:hypothetical protein JTB14_010162 [Gonioctena quinquepunctata]|nr:hypothetical protein JTB14_010162 [Gonioctena quinquepunctata]